LDFVILFHRIFYLIKISLKKKFKGNQKALSFKEGLKSFFKTKSKIFPKKIFGKLFLIGKKCISALQILTRLVFFTGWIRKVFIRL